MHNSVRFLGIPVEDRVRMTSESPAEILSLSEKARIAPGAGADLVILSTQGMVKETIVAGEPFTRRGESHAGQQNVHGDT